MSHWDRMVLLELVDAARSRMQDASISEAQKHQLRALVERYAIKTQSIKASRADVQSLKEEVFELFDSFGGGK